MKLWAVTINYLFGSETVVVRIKANTERKARIRAVEKFKKEHGDHILDITSVEMLEDKGKENKYAVKNE